MTATTDVLGARCTPGKSPSAASPPTTRNSRRCASSSACAPSSPKRRPRHSGKRLLRGLTSSAAAPKGVYLWGGVGRGKTWLMDLFYASLTQTSKRRTHFYRFMQEVHADLKRLKGKQSPLDGVADKIAKKAHVICFDELFVSDIADAMILANLFEALIKRGVALVFTSNVKPKDLYKGGLQRDRFLPTIALLEKHCEVVAVDGGVDYRLRQLTAAPIYLPSGDADTLKKLEELFDDLSDDDVESGGTITVNHRKIKVVRESENVIWFEFAALVRRPAQPGGLRGDRQRVPVGDHRQRARVRRRRRQRRAALHLGDRRVLRPRRQRDPLRRGGARRAVPRREAQVRVPAHREPARRDAEQGIPGERASRGVTGASLISISALPQTTPHC